MRPRKQSGGDAHVDSSRHRSSEGLNGVVKINDEINRRPKRGRPRKVMQPDVTASNMDARHHEQTPQSPLLPSSSDFSDVDPSESDISTLPEQITMMTPPTVTADLYLQAPVVLDGNLDQSSSSTNDPSADSNLFVPSEMSAELRAILFADEAIIETMDLVSAVPAVPSIKQIFLEYHRFLVNDSRVNENTELFLDLCASIDGFKTYFDHFCVRELLYPAERARHERLQHTDDDFIHRRPTELYGFAHLLRMIHNIIQQTDDQHTNNQDDDETLTLRECCLWLCSFLDMQREQYWHVQLSYEPDEPTDSDNNFDDDSQSQENGGSTGRGGRRSSDGATESSLSPPTVNPVFPGFEGFDF